MYRLAARRTELGLLVPVLLLVPLGVAVTHIARSGLPDPGPLAVAVAFVGLMLGAHLVLAWSGHRGDELLLPAVAAMGALGIVMLNRLPQDLAGNGLQLGMGAPRSCGSDGLADHVGGAIGSARRILRIQVKLGPLPLPVVAPPSGPKSRGPGLDSDRTFGSSSRKRQVMLVVFLAATGGESRCWPGQAGDRTVALPPTLTGPQMVCSRRDAVVVVVTGKGTLVY